jgi:hypothetical protein
MEAFEVCVDENKESRGMQLVNLSSFDVEQITGIDRSYCKQLDPEQHREERNKEEQEQEQEQEQDEEEEPSYCTKGF